MQTDFCATVLWSCNQRDIYIVLWSIGYFNPKCPFGQNWDGKECIAGNFVFISNGATEVGVYSVNGTLGRRTEIIDLNNAEFTCNGLPDFPIISVGPAGGLVQNTPLICGGVKEDFSELDDCYRFSKNSWIQVKSLPEPRTEFGKGNVVLEDELLVNGGLGRDRETLFFQIQ